MFLDGCELFSTEENNLMFLQILGTARLVVRILQIVIPIALIVWGTLDLGRAVIAKKDEDASKYKGMFVKRLLSAVLVFLVPFLVNLIMGYVAKNTWKDCWDEAGGYTIRENNFIKSMNE